MRQETINGNVHTYDDAGRLITVLAKSLTQKCPDCGHYVPDISYCAHTCWVRDLHFRDWQGPEREALFKSLDEKNKVPPILQLQADPFPTESDALAEQGFIEQDASAPIKEQCEENARLMRVVAQLKAQRNADAAQYKAIGAELAKITMLEKQFTADLDRVKAQMDALECENCRILTENAELQEKAKKYQDAVSVMANCLHELEG